MTEGGDALSATMRAAADARAIVRDAVARIDLAARVHDALPPLPPPRANVVVVAIGKAAPTMAKAAIDRWPTRIARVLVVTTDGTDASMIASGLEAASVPFEVRRAGHPLPDARSVDAAMHALALVKGRAQDLCLALISGGASSLVCAPPIGMSLENKREIVRDLLDAGAPITDVNVVRRHLSRIKGGGLARAALPSRTLALVASDVLVARAGGVEVGEAHDVGSGPASPDPTSTEDARRALERWAPRYLASIDDLLATNLSSHEPIARRAQSRIVATPHDLAHAASNAARALGYATEILPPSLDPVDRLADDYIALARSLPPGHARVRVAEPSIVVPENSGQGGRAGRLALRAWSLGLPSDVALACVGSDGVDGSSGGAGAVVFGNAPDGARDALARFDDGPFVAEHAAAIASRPTGVNLLDLHVLVRGR